MVNFCTAEGTKFGAVEDENFGTVQGGNFQFFVNFRAIFEDFEKDQKKNIRFFNLMGPLKMEKFGTAEG